MPRPEHLFGRRSEQEPPPVPPGPSIGDVLAWLDRHVNLEAIESGFAGRSAEPTLRRIAALLDALGSPERAYPFIHVTGTNGKGSTARIASSLIAAQGLKVGTYTSPHLEALNERIAVAGEPISDEELAGVLGTLAGIEQLLVERKQLDLPPTWFELVTAAGFAHLGDVAVDAAVVEVGLGGRYDATNAADGKVAVLTNVDLDHVEVLGPTREAIAGEKVGIVKPGAVFVQGEEDPSLAGLLADEARRAGADEIWQRGRDFGCISARVAHGGRVLDLRTPGASYKGLYLPLHGAHQGENAAAALAAVEAFSAGPLDASVVEAGFAAVKVPGRLEVLGRRPLVLFDGAHNEAGARALGVALEEDFALIEGLVVVMGCLRGRDPTVMLASMLAPLSQGLRRRVIACRPASPRAQGAEAVAAAARALGLEVEVEDEVKSALERGVALAGESDLVLVTGSLYVVGAARDAWRRLAFSKR